MSSEALHPTWLVRRRTSGQLLQLSLVFPVALVVGALVSLLYLNQAAVVATTGYEVRALEAERHQWQIRNQQLQLRAAQLRSLDHVADEARRLGMGPPERRIFVTRRATPLEWATPVAVSGPLAVEEREAPQGASSGQMLEDFTNAADDAVSRLLALLGVLRGTSR